MRHYTMQDVHLMVKKKYVNDIGQDIISLQSELEIKNKEISDLKATNSNLIHRLAEINSSNEYILGQTIGIYIKNTISDNSKNIHDIIADDIKNNLNVTVESRYEPYSGQKEHYHDTEVTWNGESISSSVY